MLAIAESLWSRAVDFTNQLATGARYVGIRYLVSFFALLVSGIRLAGPLFASRRTPPDSVGQAAKQPSFESAFAELADVHLKLQERYDEECARSAKFEALDVQNEIRIAELLGEVTNLRTQIATQRAAAPPPASRRTPVPDDSL